MGSGPVGGQGSGVRLPAARSHPAQLAGLNTEELKAFLREQLRNAYDIKESQIEQARPGLMREAERFFILQQIDTLWREHLQAMDALRESVGLRGYGQKDPLIEYKNEGYDMFLDMMTKAKIRVQKYRSG
jgi:preprotein translocase subunit SecA